MEQKGKSKKRIVFDRLNHILAKIFDIHFCISHGRNTFVRDDDIFIVSYPRSGNKFIRLLLSYVLYPPKEVQVTNIKKRLPSVYDPYRKLLKYDSPRILKSHEYFNPEYKKVVYLVRDPRSSAVSYFFLLKKKNVLPEEYHFSKFLPLFINGAFNSYGNWAENVGSWLGGCEYDKERFILIKYEELKNNTNKKLKEVLDFLSIEYHESSISKAVELSSFKKAQKQEQKEKRKGHNDIDIKKLHIRKGRTDEWKEYFNTHLQDMLIDAFGPVMEKVGYHKEKI